ncbi:MAG TPA: RNA-binding protein [Patescibacteria group bacterium]|jgi:RNA recognition motif-containing protein|nr:RNA-binding protein [Patescibacteria group bacterium]
MATKLFVGNLSYNTTEDTLREAFSAHGNVESVAVILDRETQRPRGFAFVEMADADAAKAAVEALNGKDLDGRQIAVSEAREREDRGPRPPRRDFGKRY